MRVLSLLVILFADHCSPEGNDYLLFWVDAAAEGHITQNEVDGVINLIDFHEQCDTEPHIQFNREIQIGESLDDEGSFGEVRYVITSDCFGAEDLEIFLPEYGWTSLSRSWDDIFDCFFPEIDFTTEKTTIEPRGLYNQNFEIVEDSLVEISSGRVILDSVVLREKIISFHKDTTFHFEITTKRGNAQLLCLDETCSSTSLIFANSPTEICNGVNAGLFEVNMEHSFVCSKLPSGMPGSSNVYSWIKL